VGHPIVVPEELLLRVGISWCPFAWLRICCRDF